MSRYLDWVCDGGPWRWFYGVVLPWMGLLVGMAAGIAALSR